VDTKKDRHMKSSKLRTRESGFTFLEVMIALALLAAAGSILIGMQSAAIKRTIRDASAQQALLAARRIMASIESIPNEEFDLASQSQQPVLDLMAQLDIPLDIDDAGRNPLKDIVADLQIEDWNLPLPEVEETAMKQITVRVSWGANQQDSLYLRLLKSLGTR
jgi:prepilin-type N-terminal cleavage/methylation domain-containing protein